MHLLQKAYYIYCTDKYWDFGLKYVLKKIDVRRVQHLGTPRPSIGSRTPIQ